MLRPLALVLQWPIFATKGDFVILNAVKNVVPFLGITLFL
jgi:hypothetical protein